MTNLIKFESWTAGIGISRSTAWRWKQKGIIETININGRHFISADAIARFEQAAVAGKFAQDNAPHLRHRK